MAAAGIRDILIANQIVGPLKMRRLHRAARERRSHRRGRQHGECRRAGRGRRRPRARGCSVVIEVDIGMNRAGVAPGAPVVGAGRARSPRVPACGFVGRDGLGKPRGHDRRSGREGAGRRPRRSACSPRAPTPAGGPATRSRSSAAAAPAPFPTAPAAGRHRSAGRRRDLQRHALPRPLSRRLPCALTLLATVTSRPTADADRPRCRQEGDERRRGHAAADRPAGGPQPAAVGRARDDRARGAERAAARSATASNSSSAIPTPRCICTRRSSASAAAPSNASGPSRRAAG